MRHRYRVHDGLQENNEIIVFHSSSEDVQFVAQYSMGHSMIYIHTVGIIKKFPYRLHSVLNAFCVGFALGYHAACMGFA